MTNKSPKPTILIVPSSFSPATFYHPLVNGLKANGLDAVVYDLPSAIRKPPEAAATLAEDAMFFNGVLSSMCKAGKDVVVLGHSYGGVVTSECARGLTEKSNGRGRVVGLFYLTALVPQVGHSVVDLMGGQGLDFVKPEGDFLYHDSAKRSAELIFSDLPLDRALEYTKKLSYQSSFSLQGALQYAGYKHVDVTAYIVCTQDKCQPPDFQQQMVENVRSGGKLAKVYKIDSDHCPNASHVEYLVELISGAVGELFS